MEGSINGALPDEGIANCGRNGSSLRKNLLLQKYDRVCEENDLKKKVLRKRKRIILKLRKTVKSLSSENEQKQMKIEDLQEAIKEAEMEGEAILRDSHLEEKRREVIALRLELRRAQLKEERRKLKRKLKKATKNEAEKQSTSAKTYSSTPVPGCLKLVIKLGDGTVPNGDPIAETSTTTETVDLTGDGTDSLSLLKEYSGDESSPMTELEFPQGPRSAPKTPDKGIDRESFRVSNEANDSTSETSSSIQSTPVPGNIKLLIESGNGKVDKGHPATGMSTAIEIVTIDLTDDESDTDSVSLLKEYVGDESSTVTKSEFLLGSSSTPMAAGKVTESLTISDGGNNSTFQHLSIADSKDFADSDPFILMGYSRGQSLISPMSMLPQGSLAITVTAEKVHESGAEPPTTVSTSDYSGPGLLLPMSDFEGQPMMASGSKSPKTLISASIAPAGDTQSLASTRNGNLALNGASTLRTEIDEDNSTDQGAPITTSSSQSDVTASPTDDPYYYPKDITHLH